MVVLGFLCVPSTTLANGLLRNLDLVHSDAQRRVHRASIAYRQLTGVTSPIIDIDQARVTLRRHGSSGFPLLLWLLTRDRRDAAARADRSRSGPLPRA
jgi:hypothetical protein